jgi:class 3 adenylate cyclase
MIHAAMEIRDFVHRMNAERTTKGQETWEMRIGIHVGPLVAGVVGKKKFAYDIWGSTVNVASRMESNGVPDQINISAATYELVKDSFDCTYRGKIYAKNVGEIDMYFVNGEVAAS